MGLRFWRRGGCGGSVKPAAAPRLPGTDGEPVLGSEGTGKLVPGGHMAMGLSKAAEKAGKCGRGRIEGELNALSQRRLVLQGGLDVQYGRQADVYINGGYGKDVAGLSEENDSIIRLSVATYICRGMEAAERVARKSSKRPDAGLYDLGLCAAEVVMDGSYYVRGVGEIKGAYGSVKDSLDACMHNAGVRVPLNFPSIVVEYKLAVGKEVEERMRMHFEAQAHAGGFKTPEELLSESRNFVGEAIERAMKFLSGLFGKHNHK